jgi:hypothetical protein
MSAGVQLRFFFCLLLAPPHPTPQPPASSPPPFPSAPSTPTPTPHCLRLPHPVPFSPTWAEGKGELATCRHRANCSRKRTVHTASVAGSHLRAVATSPLWRLAPRPRAWPTRRAGHHRISMVMPGHALRSVAMRRRRARGWAIGDRDGSARTGTAAAGKGGAGERQRTGAWARTRGRRRGRGQRRGQRQGQRQGHGDKDSG